MLQLLFWRKLVLVTLRQGSKKLSQKLIKYIFKMNIIILFGISLIIN